MATLQQKHIGNITIEDIFEKQKKLPGRSPVLEMIKEKNFNLHSCRKYETPTKRAPGEFVGSDVHGSQWKPPATKAEAIKNRVFLNDYVYHDFDCKVKRKPRPPE